MDANVVIAAFLRDSTVRRILALSLLDFFVPEFLDLELDRHLGSLLSRTRMSRAAAEELRRLLQGYVRVIPEEAIRPFLAEASTVMDRVDPKDTVYLAAALSIPCDGIWSDDHHFQEQTLVPCWTTKALLKELRSEGLKV